jgi:lipid-binding SYLF domain-containing protein
VSFARSMGLYLGVSLEGAVLEPRASWNQSYYGKTVTPSEIVGQRAVARPAGAAPLADALHRISSAQ